MLIYIATLIISRIPIPLWNVQMKLASYKIMMRTIIQNGSYLGILSTMCFVMVPIGMGHIESKTSRDGR